MKKKEFIIEDLLSKIYQEVFETGKLPNQRDLAIEYGVSRFTVQQAIKDLSEMGIVQVIQGSGIFVNKKWVKNPLVFNSLTRTPYDRIESKMIKLEKDSATKKDQQIFQVEENAAMWRFERIRIVNYKIEQLEISKMPVVLFPDLTKSVIEGSIQQYVENKGHKISHHITSYEPIVTTKAQSNVLLCKRGTPAMQITNRSIFDEGQVFEYSEITAIDYSVTYIRPFDRQSHNYRSH